VIPEAPEGEPAVDREVSDPSERLAVRAGWQLIDAYERLSVAGARRVFGREVDAWRQYTDDTLARLTTADGRASVHETPNTQLRYRRVMDFARSGDRVFDVGFGQGFLAAQLVKRCDITSYHGIDIDDRYLAGSKELFADNGLIDASITLEIGDLYDLTREKVASRGADLVICCEVLEHVPDAELALRTLADALPDGSDLIFSVPLIGRLEGVWGHVSTFGVARLKQMLEGAGLYAHHVEPLSNVWALVVASRDPGPSQRVRGATHRPPTRVEVPLSRSFDFLDVKSGDYAVRPDDAGVVSVAPADDVTVTVSSTGSGGVTFPVPGLEALRLALDLTEVEGLEQIAVIARAGGKQTCRWEWTADEFPTGHVAVKVRPGEADGRFASSEHKNVYKSDQVEVVLTVRDGGTSVIGLAASVLP
jgi:2-polyprenyl-3-methyl-5-hydroxy-6-metoxy-1,4-benzoquinol methylase